MREITDGIPLRTEEASVTPQVTASMQQSGLCLVERARAFLIRMRKMLEYQGHRSGMAMRVELQANSCGMAAVAELIGEDWNALGSV